MRQNNKIAGLDTLRFVAFLWVFIGHATPYWKYGYCGIYLFFVLSSFLLTYLSLVEIKETGTFSKKNFFARRCLRIYPLYYLIIISSFIFLPLLERILELSISLPSKKYLYFVFLSNFNFTDHIYALKFLWSISVEEQFYILFILVSTFFKRNFLIPIVLFYVFYFIGFFFKEAYNLSGYMLTTNYFPFFGAGMIAGKMFFDKKTPKTLTLYFYTIALFVLIPMFNTSVLLKNFVQIPIAFFTTCIILLTIKLFNYYQTTKTNLLITEYWGKYTYGLYVYSGFVITFVSKIFSGLNIWLTLVVETIILFTVAWISYTYFESYFIKLKNDFKKYKSPFLKHESIKS